MLLQNDTQVKSQKDWCNRKLTSTIKKKKKRTHLCLSAALKAS